MNLRINYHFLYSICSLSIHFCWSRDMQLLSYIKGVNCRMLEKNVHYKFELVDAEILDVIDFLLWLLLSSFFQGNSTVMNHVIYHSNLIGSEWRRWSPSRIATSGIDSSRINILNLVPLPLNWYQLYLHVPLLWLNHLFHLQPKVSQYLTLWISSVWLCLYPPQSSQYYPFISRIWSHWLVTNLNCFFLLFLSFLATLLGIYLFQVDEITPWVTYIALMHLRGVNFSFMLLHFATYPQNRCFWGCK